MTGIESVARRARRQLASLSRPAAQFDAKRYFRGETGLGFYNVGTTAVRGLARSIVADHAEWTVKHAQRFAHLLIVDRYLEVKGLGVEVLARYRRDFTRALLPGWRRWLARGYSANWATTDAICGLLIGPLLVAEPSLIAEMPVWARDRNLWVRRASAVSLIPPVRRALALTTAYRIARMLHTDKEDLIQKAVGWLLREAGKMDADRLEAYLLANGPTIPRTTVRYAIERFDETTRKSLLTATLPRRSAEARISGGGAFRVRFP